MQSWHASIVYRQKYYDELWVNRKQCFLYLASSSSMFREAEKSFIAATLKPAEVIEDSYSMVWQSLGQEMFLLCSMCPCKVCFGKHGSKPSTK